ncbi:DUF1697 domain-containing protein [Paenibacillus albiflavus]|uniref:DUF1697 domain-containing protein n=1 Tax=Paenibacillus albiflavus TaxID=2545760 RepID=A0A4R4ENX7_9BACL|nr:DUF1697 domain-containing protein [Paenibacillus albiflavus]TCZ80145.1 DUF1697 domain-containing protein [Paenibacillus albiflavus]
MTIYVALLRAINVSGHNMIKMAELKSMLESMGLQQIQTYIQSGNVVFEAKGDAETLRLQIEDQIKLTFQLTIDVIIRTADELRQIITECPYDENTLPEGAGIHVSFIQSTPPQDRAALLSNIEEELDKCHLVGRDLYLLLHKGVKNSKVLSASAKLRVPATVRNWRTVNKLLAMVDDIERTR